MFRRARRVLLLATAGTVALTMAVPAVSAQAYSVGSYYKLVNYNDAGCADISTYNNYVVDATCAQGVGAEKWLLDSASGGAYKFHNQQYGGCIEDQGGDAFDGLCTAGDTMQKFALQSTSRSGYYKLVLQSDGTCLTSLGGVSGLEFFVCSAGDGEQYWELQAAS